MSLWAGVIPTWVFLVFMIAMLGLLFWVGIYQGNVRPSYRQDPFKEPESDKKFYGGLFVCLSPIFFRPFLEGHMVAAAIAFAVWGVFTFWLLESGAMDPASRLSGERAQTSNNE